VTSTMILSVIGSLLMGIALLRMPDT